MEEFLQVRTHNMGIGEQTVFVDACFAETFAWNMYDNPINISVHELCEAALCCSAQKIKNIVVFASCLAKDSADLLRRLLTKLSCQQCTIFTSVSPEAASGNDYSTSRRKKHGEHFVDNGDYGSLKEFLGLPNISITITYIPLHTLHLLFEVSQLVW